MALLLVLAIPATAAAAWFFVRAVSNPYRDLDKALSYAMTLGCGIVASAFWIGFVLVRFGEWPWPKRDSRPDTRQRWEQDLPYR